MTVLMVDAGSAICSGAAIDLNITEHNFTMNGMWSVPPIPGKSTGSSYNVRLSSGQYVGIENPVHILNGYYQSTLGAGENKTNKDNNGAYFVTGSMLTGMMLSGEHFALIDSELITNSEYGNGSMVYVVPVSLKAVRNPASYDGTKVGYIINYSLTCSQVKFE